MTDLVERETYTNDDFSARDLPGSSFEGCAFVNCRFMGANLSGLAFSECTFQGCDLSNAKTDMLVLKGVRFDGCKLLGLDFEKCSKRLFSMDCANSILNLSAFSRLTLKKMKFVNSTLHEVDFTEANLTGALFDHCDLSRTRFDRTILEKADFRTSWGYAIDPERNKLKKALFSLTGVTGLLAKYDILIE
jgi:fluoroquinolone resistance protein